ncbi:probable ethanolamine kinase [Selaginella moellendorffii]|uniref:probable ethanolamine kinase n=1 Tax=Selaginella moellendorffii TaxID=88036 RepID=UPI000D1C7EFD|nr:probable ethanolamine kinase [Selaginella moellendorffii]|eukprot:XP_024533558.1 probable ethanolamine kinase [Selaginella moellendorffii]
MKAHFPECALSVDSLLPFQDMEAQIINVCRALIPELQDADDSDFDVCRINGGITNIMAKVSKKDQSVVVRVFGPATEGVIDRDREIQATCHFSRAGFCPELKGVFKNGIIQTFVTARTLTPEDFLDDAVVAKVAKELRRLHQQEVPGEKEPMVWTEINRYFELASAVTKFENPENQRKLEAVSFDELRQEINTLKEIGARLKGPVVYAHNDLLPGNVMVDAQGKYYFIDFEYSGYNYRGFDIGTHFNEYAGLDCDFCAYPSKDRQLNFLRHYLRPDDPEKATHEELEELFVEANFYALPAHITWSAWAIVQATSSAAIDFDYMSYFFKRMKMYREQKAKFLPVVRGFLAGKSK